MLNFESDYIMGAHPRILEALMNSNDEALSGYGRDKYTKEAEDLIRQACEDPLADVFFLTGGTQANKTIIATALKDYEGVIAPATPIIPINLLSNEESLIKSGSRIKSAPF